MEAATLINTAYDAELELVEFWKEILGIDKVEPQDNFFELGGDSITALQLA